MAIFFNTGMVKRRWHTFWSKGPRDRPPTDLDLMALPSGTDLVNEAYRAHVHGYTLRRVPGRSPFDPMAWRAIPDPAYADGTGKGGRIVGGSRIIGRGPDNGGYHWWPR